MLPSPGLAAALLKCCISTQFWVYVCLAKSWIIKDKHIFNACVALLGLLLVVLSVWSGTGFNKIAWAEGEGEEAVLEEEERREGLFNRSLVQAQGSQSCCLLPERGPRKSGNYAAPFRSQDGRMNEPTAQQDWEGTFPLT